MKLENAYARKAVAMVVYDREDSDTLEDMKLSACKYFVHIFSTCHT